MLSKNLVSSAGSAETLYVDDVFSTYVYTGNGTSQTITNGIDLAGRGGLVWIKSRNDISDHILMDTERGLNKQLSINKASDEDTTTTNNVTAFNSDGFSIGSNSNVNNSGFVYVAWTFRKARGFFDIVTYTGTGSSNAVPHNLGVTPGIILVKNRDTASTAWTLYNHALGGGYHYNLGGDIVATTARFDLDATATTFNVNTNNTVNAAGQQFVAYLWADNGSDPDGLVRTGYYVGDGSNANVTTDWEPQFLMMSDLGSTSSSTYVSDATRGATKPSTSIVNWSAYANTTAAEANTALAYFTATGFNGVQNVSARNYLWLAIRRPNKPPASGADVFNPLVYTGTITDNRFLNTGIYTDMIWARIRSSAYDGILVGNRLLDDYYWKTATDIAWTSDADALDRHRLVSEIGNPFSSMSGLYIGNDATANINISTTTNEHMALAFRRAPGAFDLVRYEGTSSAQTVPHNLGAVPELIIVKNTNTALTDPIVYEGFYGGATNFLKFNTIAASAASSTYWNNTAPTDTGFTVGISGFVNGSTTYTFIAMLFATVPGVTKVGTYVGTGTGSTQVINCGFTAGARFVMIKALTSSGNWYVHDTARGLGAGNDPSISTNQSSAEESQDRLFADSSGFGLEAKATLNGAGVTYLFLAIA